MVEARHVTSFDQSACFILLQATHVFPPSWLSALFPWNFWRRHNNNNNNKVATTTTTLVTRSETGEETPFLKRALRKAYKVNKIMIIMITVFDRGKIDSVTILAIFSRSWVQIFFPKRAKIFSNFLVALWKMALLRKTTVATFWATFRLNWATHYFNIKSHWKQLIERFMWKERKIGANFPSSLTSSVTRWQDWFLIFGHLKQRNFDTKQVQIDSLKVGSQLGQISNKHLKCCTNISKFLLH